MVDGDIGDIELVSILLAYKCSKTVDRECRIFNPYYDKSRNTE